MSVWEDIVGQKGAVGIFQAAAVSARELRQTDKDGGDSGSLARKMSQAWLITGRPVRGVRWRRLLLRQRCNAKIRKYQGVAVALNVSASSKIPIQT